MTLHMFLPQIDLYLTVSDSIDFQFHKRNIVKRFFESQFNKVLLAKLDENDRWMP